MLKQTYTQKLTQKFLPRIILNQNILSIPTMALENIIKHELELNPMLEEGSEVEEINEFEQEEEAQEISLDDPVQIDSADKQHEGSAPEEEANFENDTPDTKEEFDWNEYFENEAEEYKSYDGDRSNSFDNNNIREALHPLSDSLILQLQLAELNAKFIFIGEEIIGSLTDNGFFTENPEEILQDLNTKKAGTEFESENFTIEELENVLSFIQKNLDPTGIGARNLKECLEIQIERSDKSEKLKKISVEVIKNHFEDLKNKKYEKIRKEQNITMEDVKEIIEFIHKLNPKPGFTEESSVESYIIPDLVVKKVDDKYEIFLNERYKPSLRISRAYKDLYSDGKNNLDKTTKEYIVNNFNRAKWFIDAINSRKDTLLKIMDAILKRQENFFDDNDTGLKPMYEKEVADDISMDTSTVSRAVRGKYVQTDFGIYELRSFFTTPLAMNEGDDVSNVEAKKKLKELIDRENKSKPLTDEELGIEMNRNGFRIARRTIAKYREAIDIPIAKLRREI